MSNIVRGIDLDLAAGPGYSFEPTEVLLREFDENVAELRRTLSDAKNSDFEGTWHVRSGPDIYNSAERQDALRLLDVPIPQLYGPTADER
jgi:hypothetical protein